MEKLQIEYLPISDLTMYEHNARRHKDKDVDAIANSIHEFGFNDPIGVWGEDNVIVEGHGRLMAAQKLNLEEVPIIRLDHLTDEQRRAYALAHNKTAELSEWDIDLLNSELDNIIDLDMSDFGFDLNFDDDIDIGYYGDERERTYNAVNLNEYDSERSDGFYQMPVITAQHYIPDSLLPFNYVLSKDKFKSGVHFFIDDYQFERIWNSPEKYIDRLSKFSCCLTPDFSLYMDMPIAMQIWNVYRSRMIGQIMQDNGIKVIPTLSWSSKDSYSFCFDGIEKGGTVAVSTVGCVRDAKEVWFAGMDEAIHRLEPSCVLVYGSDIGYEFKTKVKFFDYRKWV